MREASKWLKLKALSDQSNTHRAIKTGQNLHPNVPSKKIRLKIG